MFKINNIFLVVFIILIPSILYSQHTNYHLGNQVEREVSRRINSSGEVFHTGFKPLMKSKIEPKIPTPLLVDTTSKKHGIAMDWLVRKSFKEDLFVIEKKDLNIYINLLIDLKQGQDELDTSSFSQNTRAFEIYGDLGNKVSFYSSFYENQAFFPEYIDNKIANNFVVPGQGSWKEFKKDGKPMGRDYGYASGYLSFSPAKFFNFQIGHSKHFVGEGYRSLLLSDNSFNYPFMKFNFDFGKFQYTSLYTEFQFFTTKYYNYHHKKHGSFNYFSYSPHHKITLGVFEGIIWKTSDYSTYVKKFSVNFFNPVMLIRPFQYGLNDNNNIILGLNFKFIPINYTEIYGQFVLDNFEFDKLGGENGYFENKYGYQVGGKIYDLIFDKIKNINLYLQAEYNMVSSYTYSHKSLHQEYSHYNQALAHPLGAGFTEGIFIANLNVYNFYVQFKINSARTSMDTLSSNFGSNIFLENVIPEQTSYGNKIGQGLATTINNTSYTFGYIFNKTTNLQVFTSIQFRDYSNSLYDRKERFIYFGIKTSIDNFYYDW